MGIRSRNGMWHYRFEVDGREYTGSTGLDATPRNRISAQRAEAKARELVVSGKGHELRQEARSFTDAAADFLAWAESEHRGAPATAKRLRTSFRSLTEFFASKPVGSLLSGHVERYKAWRRTEHQVRDVTLRHDLHALSKAFGYWRRQNWCRGNPVKDVEIPSDRDAVREHILTAREEAIYFAFCRTRNPDLYDFGRLLLNLGMRPWEELACLRKEHVDLVAGTLRIVESKSRAGRRELRLTAEAREILARRMQTPGPWVFPGRKEGAHVTKMNVGHDAVCRATGLQFVPYDLRHTCATRWAEAGMPAAVLARNLGHGDLRTIMRYIHVRPEAAHRAIDDFDRANTDQSYIDNIKRLI